VWFGAGAALCQGVGMVLASNGLRGDIDALSGQTVRMSAGALGIIVIAFIVSRMNQAQRNASARSLDETKNPAPNIPRTHALTSAAIIAMVIGTFTGPILGVWCSLYALQKLEVGIATTLMSLVPVMILPVTRITEGRWPSARAILGALIAVAGVAVLATAPHAATV
jgi:drug/metabolite transporter (DMT)-like permease